MHVWCWGCSVPAVKGQEVHARDTVCSAAPHKQVLNFGCACQCSRLHLCSVGWRPLLAQLWQLFADVADH